MKHSPPHTLDYRAAGVDISAGNQLVERIKPLAQRTFRPEVVTGIGGFAALFALPLDRFRCPLLVSSTDGVGTKLKIAQALNQFATIGIDLVAMCANDILVTGAEPLFFLDYYACGQLNVTQAEQVIAGIATGCQHAGMALIGGETAEMPGVYQAEDYDLAGFCVGIVEQDRVIDGHHVQVGDVLIGIASSGLHSNGYSLARKIVEVTQTPLSMPFVNSTLGEVLLTPTRIYVKPLLSLFAHVPIHAVAHITGGGLVENVPRVLPDGVMAVIDRSRWSRPAIFDWLQQQGHIADAEMWRVFNNGIGMVLCVAPQHVETTRHILHEAGETSWLIGHIADAAGERPWVRIVG